MANTGSSSAMNPDRRDPRHWISVTEWMRTLRHAARALWRAPGFSVAVFCSLVVCMGPNAAILSVLYALVMKPLPFSAADQLVTIVNVGERSGGQVVPSSTPQYEDFVTHAYLFAGFTGVQYAGATLDQDSAPVRVTFAAVRGDFFRVLGVKAVVGRLFTPSEQIAGSDHVVVLSQTFWESHYAADPAVVGREVSVNDEHFTVVGVAPRSLESLHDAVSIFRPYVPAADKYDPQARYRGDLLLYARLKPNVSIGAAVEQLTALEENFRARLATPKMRAFMANAGFRIRVVPLRPGGAVGNMHPLWLLQSGALLVLLIGCVNVMNLFLARMNARRTELSIRIALGAGRGALLRHTLAESLLPTAAAAVVGLGIAALATRVFNAYLPLIVPSAPPVPFDGAIIGSVIAAAGAIAVCVAWVPLHLILRTGLRIGDARTASAGAGTRIVSGMLVTGQVALAVVLLVGASLLLRSFAKVMAVNPGFDPTHLVQARLSLPLRYVPRVSLEQRYRAPNAAANLDVQRRIVAVLRAIPGVENVAESLDTLLVSNIRPVPFSLRGAAGADGAGESEPLIHINSVSPDFFATMGMRVVSGRAFSEADNFSTVPVAIVDDTFIRRYFPGRVAEGQEIFLSRGLPLAVDSWARIVGVVTRAKLTALDDDDNLPIVYVPTVGFPAANFGLIVRSARPTADLLREMQQAVHQIDPTLSLASAGSLEQRFQDMLMPRRGITLLLAVFSGLALLLAAIGLYGVLAYDVSQRTREIGIRGAIGATRAQILLLILREGITKAGLGLLAGTIGAMWLTHYLGALLFGVHPVDVISYTVVLGLLMIVSVIACLLPARRAAEVDPITALRAE